MNHLKRDPGLTPVEVVHWTLLNKNIVVEKQTQHNNCLIQHRSLQGFKVYNSFKIKSQKCRGKKTWLPISSNNNILLSSLVEE